MGARLWFGIVILGLGVLWTLDNLGLIESRHVLAWWPLVLVAVGLSKLVGRRAARPLGAALWIGIGVWLLGYNLGLIPWGIFELWPLLLIVLGLAIVHRALRGPRAMVAAPVGVSTDGCCAPAAAAAPGTDVFSCTAIWAGVDRTVTSQAFRGGDYTAIMGGGDLNLRGARPVPGGAVVEVFVVMGGLEILVPEDWYVVNQLYALMGGVEDGRNAAPAEGDRVLYLKGIVIMGGIEIKN